MKANGKQSDAYASMHAVKLLVLKSAHYDTIEQNYGDRGAGVEQTGPGVL